MFQFGGLGALFGGLSPPRDWFKKTMFLAHFRSLKKLQIFFKLLGIMHATHPYLNFHWHPLTSRKKVWPKITWSTSQNDFQSILLLVGGARKSYPFHLPLSASAYIPTYLSTM